jgi:signal peptidase I
MKMVTTVISKMKTKFKTAHLRDVKMSDKRILALIAVLGIIFHIGYANYIIMGDSMQSTYKEGEKILINKIVYKFSQPHLGDIVVFYDERDDEVLIKRIIGIPYDTIEIIEGVIFVNDVMLVDQYSHLLIATLLCDFDEEPLRDWVTGEYVYQYANFHKVYLNHNEYWAIGDNRTSSWFGIVKEEDIVGQLIE